MKEDEIKIEFDNIIKSVNRLRDIFHDENTYLREMQIVSRYAHLLNELDFVRTIEE